MIQTCCEFNILITFYIPFFQFSSTAIHRHLTNCWKLIIVIWKAICNYQNTPANKAKAVHILEFEYEYEQSLVYTDTLQLDLVCVCIVESCTSSKWDPTQPYVTVVPAVSFLLIFFWAKAVSY